MVRTIEQIKAEMCKLNDAGLVKNYSSTVASNKDVKLEFSNIPTSWSERGNFFTPQVCLKMSESDAVQKSLTNVKLEKDFTRYATKKYFDALLWTELTDQEAREIQIQDEAEAEAQEKANQVSSLIHEIEELSKTHNISVSIDMPYGMGGSCDAGEWNASSHGC